MSSLALALFLAFAPPPDGTTDALTQLDEASLAAANTVDPEVLATLAGKLDAVDSLAPALADDPAARQRVIMARLNLARGYLKAGDQAAAEREIDRVLREAFDDTVPAGRFGPDVSKLARERQAALDGAGKAKLELVCHQPCEVLVGARRIDPAGTELYLGTYALRVRSVDGSVEPLERSVELSEAGATVTIEFGAAPQPEPEPEPAPEPEPEPAPAPVVDAPAPVVPPKRIAPRGIEIDGLVFGAGLMVAGGIMLGFDGKCTDGSDSPRACPKIFEGTAGGIASLAVGGALLITSAVLLAIDERKLAKHESTQAKAARVEFELGVLRF